MLKNQFKMDQNNIYDVIVIGAGASGVGCGLHL